MEKELAKIFFNPKTGFTNLNDLYDKVKDKDIGSFNKIKEWYNSNAINQIYKPPRLEFNRIISATNEVGTLQIDLMDISRFKRDNHGYKFIFVVIDIHSRFVWAFPSKDKKASSFVTYMKKVLDDIKEVNPNAHLTVRSDKGSEFLGDFKKLLVTKGVIIYYNDPENRKYSMGVVERFNRTLWQIIKKYSYYNETLSFIDHLDDFIENYNNKRHSTLGQKPIDVFRGDKHVNEVQNEITILPIGGIVRRLLNHSNFDKKSYQMKFSTDMYRIVDREGFQYTIKNLKTNKVLDKRYLSRQLLLIRSLKEEDNGYTNLLRVNNCNNKFISKQSKTGLDIDDRGQFVINKRLIPKDQKRITRSSTIDWLPIDKDKIISRKVKMRPNVRQEPSERILPNGLLGHIGTQNKDKIISRKVKMRSV